MKKAFTLIELIFVIVIIGLLSAVVVPKFLNLKQHAEVNNVIKNTIDGAQQAVEAAVNLIDMEGKQNFGLKDIVKIKGKGWKYINEHNGSYEYNDTTDPTKLIAEINFSINPREVNYSINCNNFSDPKSKAACIKELNNTTVFEHLTY